MCYFWVTDLSIFPLLKLCKFFILDMGWVLTSRIELRFDCWPIVGFCMNVELFLDYITCMVFLVYFNDRSEHFSEWNTAPYETNLLTTYSILCLIIILFILAYWSIKNYIFSNFISLILYKIKILLYGINLIFNKTLEFWWFFWVSSKI